MPGLDRTGPQSEGPRTGRGMGRCNPKNKNTGTDEQQGSDQNQTYGRGLGMGRGRGGGRGRAGGRGMGRVRA